MAHPHLSRKHVLCGKEIRGMGATTYLMGGLNYPSPLATGLSGQQHHQKKIQQFSIQSV